MGRTHSLEVGGGGDEFVEDVLMTTATAGAQTVGNSGGRTPELLSVNVRIFPASVVHFSGLTKIVPPDEPDKHTARRRLSQFKLIKSGVCRDISVSVGPEDAQRKGTVSVTFQVAQASRRRMLYCMILHLEDADSSVFQWNAELG